jgi:long-chain acyl-CoA synthetase
LANRSPLENLYHWEKEIPEQVFFRQPVDGQWHLYSYRKATDEIRRMAAALQDLSLPPGSNIAILSKNCAHWIMADFAIWMAGHVSVPLYPNLTSSSIRQILDHCQAKAIFLGKLDDYASQESGLNQEIIRISFPLYGSASGLKWDELIAAHEPLSGMPLRSSEELVTIMYTSGTTGMPKGVMFNFSQLSWTAETAIVALQQQHQLPVHAKLFSYLPLCHIAERMITELAGTMLGSTITFADSLETFAGNLMATQPHLFFGVPRIYAKFQEKIFEKLPPDRLALLLAIPGIGTLLKRQLKKKLGLAEANVIGIGAAPAPAALIDWYRTLGIVLRDIYGMTENGGVCSFNLKEIRSGTVGQPWPGVEVRLGEGGEIQTRHPGTMMGYYKEPELTVAMFTADGFLKSGDVGEFDSDRFLRITGRIKDIFKTDKGKYVAPTPIEMNLLTNQDIDQVCVVGMGIPQPIALVVLSNLGKGKSRPQVTASLSATLKLVNEGLESYEKLETVVIMKEDWSIANGLLTPTLKVKRNEVEKIHLPKYPSWYHEKGVVVWE